MMKIIKIEGMGCEHCIESVKNVLKGFDEIEILEVKLGEAKINVPDDYNFDRLIEELEETGYEVN